MDKDRMIQKCRWCAILVVTLFLIAFSWQSDDAYHAYVMARNLVEGNGFVYMVGERVNASTCPLWTLICAGAYALSGNMYASTLILGILVSAASFALIAHQCSDWRTLIFCATLFVCGPCLVFGVSGLENCLLFLLSGLLLHVLLSAKEYMGRKDLFYIALIMALLAWTRMDIALLYAPACVCVYLKRRALHISFLSSAGIALLGLSPFVLWLLFSTWYYGFPFPNTAYAKLATMLPKTYYLSWGVSYIFWSCFCYVSIPVALGISVYLCCRKTARQSIPVCLCAGMALYLLYIINVGGDFMVGRHCSVVLYVSLFLIARLLPQTHLSKTIPLKLSCGVVAWTCVSVISANMFFFFESYYISEWLHAKYDIKYVPHHNILHSKGYSMEITWWGIGNSSSLLHPDRYEIGNFCDAFGNPSNSRLSDWMRHTQPPLSSVVKMHMAPGCVVYQIGPAIHVIDDYGLGDALIARLQSTQSNPRIGHVARTIPEGYEESLKNGENQIVDPQIHEFYNHLKIVISGDLFSTERLREIYRFNVGQYSDLLRP